MTVPGPLGCPCAGAHLDVWHEYDRRPDGETVFPALDGVAYRRALLRCGACGHVVSRHDMPLRDLYDGQYVAATYGDDGVRDQFARIVALPPERSDNHWRVRRVVAYAARHLAAPAAEGRAPDCLDVGSGLAVFPHVLAREGWRCVALDPDARAARHAREVAGVEAVHADFLTGEPPGPFDVVTLNKVIEHVEDPVGMLARAGRCVRPGGFVYVEVPDAEGAATEGPGREEFFIEHLHAFSAASLAQAAARAGLVARRIDRLREPSTKFTLVAYLHPGWAA